MTFYIWTVVCCFPGQNITQTKGDSPLNVFHEEYDIHVSSLISFHPAVQLKIRNFVSTIETFLSHYLDYSDMLKYFVSLTVVLVTFDSRFQTFIVML